ncbi:MAG: helix-turn-helix transcriptional regulator [Lachnospiraceae bacterium]|nr:helix-turn-helix transcriptional regulator [Lachnospiraceae bacterium]
MVLMTAYNRKTPKIPVCVTSIGVSHFQEPIFRPDGLDVYQYFFCLEGEGEIIISGEKARIGPGMGFVIEKNISHSYKSVTKDWKVSVIGIDGDLCQQIVKLLKIEKSGPFICVNSSELLNKLKKIYAYVQGLENADMFYLSKLSYDFLLDFSKSIHRVLYNDVGKTDELTQKITQYMEQHYSEPISIQEIADHVQLSREYACTYFKKQTGQTIIHTLLKIRLIHARLLLVQYPTKKIYDIAKMCGFDNASYFCYVFRKRIGLSPDKYRKQHL